LAIAPVTAAAEDGHAGTGIAQPLRHGLPERTGTAPVTRIDVVMTLSFTGRTNRGWNTDHTGTILGNGQPARPAPLPVTGLTMAMVRFTSGR
jgi:hypothetical protein